MDLIFFKERWNQFSDIYAISLCPYNVHGREKCNAINTYCLYGCIIEILCKFEKLSRHTIKALQTTTIPLFVR